MLARGADRRRRATSGRERRGERGGGAAAGALLPRRGREATSLAPTGTRTSRRSTRSRRRSGPNTSTSSAPARSAGCSSSPRPSPPGVSGHRPRRRTADPYDPQDAIYSAANYLHASGAPGNWPAAIFAYNHAGWYVAQVQALAPATAAPAACSCSRRTSPKRGAPNRQRHPPPRPLRAVEVSYQTSTSPGSSVAVRTARCRRSRRCRVRRR